MTAVTRPCRSRSHDAPISCWVANGDNGGRPVTSHAPTTARRCGNHIASSAINNLSVPAPTECCSINVSPRIPAPGAFIQEVENDNPTHMLAA